MSWLYLPEQAAEYSVQNTYLDGKPFVTLSGKDTRSMSSRPGSGTDTSTTRQSGRMYGHSASVTTNADDLSGDCGKYGVAWWLRRAFRANHSVTPVRNWERTILETAGLIQLGLLERYDPALSFSKTFPVLSHPVTFLPLLKTWWTARTRSSRHSSYLLVTLELTIRESGSGLWPTPKTATGFYQVEQRTGKKKYTLMGMAHYNLWPTPTSRLSQQRGPQAKRFTDPKRSNDLDDAVAFWATPSARDWRSGKASEETHQRNSRPLSEQVGKRENGGQLNPTWVEWLMGWPLGWTDLRPLATDRFQTWLRSRGKF